VTATVEALQPTAYGPVWDRGDDGKWVLPVRTIGWEILGWTAKFLRQPDGDDAGQPWKYTPEQARLLLWWYSVDEQGRFTYRYGVMRRPKGHGKDPFAASLALVELCGPCRFAGWSADGQPKAKPHPAPWVQVAAVNIDQTRNTFTLFPGMVSDRLKNESGMDIGKTIIYARQGRARLEAVTSSPRALEGGRGTFVIMNETHHWLVGNEGIQMAKVIKRNAGKSRDASSRALAITNAHLPGEGSVGEKDWEAFEKERAGEIPAMGVLYDSIEAPDGLDPKNRDDVAAGILAARGDSHWASVERTVQEFMDPGISDAEAQRFYWNKICGSDSAWIDLETWKSRRLEEPLELGDRICLGFDGSLREDSTALVACRLVDGHTVPLAIWEKPEGPAGNGWQVPRLEVDGLVDKAFRDYDVVRMYCDPPHWQDYVDRWAATYGDKVVLEFWTNSGIRMAKALERLHTAVMAGELTHNGDPILSRHVGNAVGVHRAGGVQINKRKKSDKIDAVVASTLAYEARNDAIADGALVNPLAAYIPWGEL
jgi:hypothetical protein